MFSQKYCIVIFSRTRYVKLHLSKIYLHYTFKNLFLSQIKIFIKSFYFIFLKFIYLFIFGGGGGGGGDSIL